VQSIDKLESLVNYFNNYPLLGVKAKDFKCWEIVYNMIVSKNHLFNKKNKNKVNSIWNEKQ
jgi:hypothetical protein